MTSKIEHFRVTSTTLGVAVIGAGIAGAACAVALQRAGLRVTVFDKSRGVGGRMATRRIAWRDAIGAEQTTELDHGAQHFGTQSPRFAAVIERAAAAGAVQAWQPRVHAPWPAATDVRSFVATPNMTALCRHLLQGIDVRCERLVQRLRRDDSCWRLVIADSTDAGPFDHVVLAMPPAQAAALLVGHHDAWSQSLASLPMDACWTLMAITDDVDWTWDAAVPERGPLAWITRNDRKPGRASPRGVACWVAHATPQWTAPRLEAADPRTVVEELQQALQTAVSPTHALAWRHCSVHRWRYAAVTHPTADGAASWWDRDLGLGVCGDFLGAGDVEAAWRSGDELADTLAASTEDIAAGAGTPTAGSSAQAVS